ncbi:MAG: TIGR02647 family protein [Gammaproteobacteria bacterium]|nr:MAG: TIGR02647 family protein [Gammaproteobacteria bacterium]
MPFNQQVTDELNILAMFNLNTTQEGVKVHSSATPEMVSAAQRLFDKGLITQADGGYLTDLGRTAAQHAQDLLLIVKG